MFCAGAGRLCPDRAALERYMQAPGFDHRRQVALEEPLPFPLPETAAAAAAEARVTAYGLNRIEASVDAPAPGLLVFGELYYPGWTATVDGAEAVVHRADGCLRGVPVASAGHHTVVLRFLPGSFVRGAWISGLTLALTLGGLAAARRRGLSRSPAPEGGAS